MNLQKCFNTLSKNVSQNFQKQIKNMFGVTEEIVSKGQALYERFFIYENLNARFLGFLF